MYLVQQPDPNQPKPEGQQMSPLEGEHLGVVNKWPPSLPAALQRWGTTQPKSPCLTALDNAGKPVYTLTYGRYLPVDDRPRIYNRDGKQYQLLFSFLCGFRTNNGQGCLSLHTFFCNLLSHFVCLYVDLHVWGC